MVDTILKTRFCAKNVLSELKTIDGRVDAVLFSDSRVFVIEYKYGKSPKIALQQIHDKKYYNAAMILESKRPILLLGISVKVSKSKSENKSVEISYELHRDGSG